MGTTHPQGSKDLDIIDQKILKFLSRDSRTAFTKIAKDLSISEGTVRQRVNGLITRGIIRRFTIETAEVERIRAVTLLSAMPEVSIPDIAEEIGKVLGVEKVYELSGEYDLLAEISGEDVGFINDCIDEIRHVRGVSKTNTLIVLKTWY
jgi:DNA-binding Lrp family transcriptional regulator